MEVDEATLRRLIREEVWAAMNITERLMDFAGIGTPVKGARRLKAQDVLDAVNQHHDGASRKDIVEALGGGDMSFASGVTTHLIKLHKAGKILRFGERGGDGYTYKPLFSHGG